MITSTKKNEQTKTTASRLILEELRLWFHSSLEWCLGCDSPTGSQCNVWGVCRGPESKWGTRPPPPNQGEPLVLPAGNSPLPGVAVGCCEQHSGSAVTVVQPCCASQVVVLADMVFRGWSGCSTATPRPRWVTAGSVLSPARSCMFLFHCLWFCVETFQFTKLPWKYG